MFDLVAKCEYRLTTDLYVQTIMAFCRAMALERPVVMGCSMGGRVVLHLALKHAIDFRAVALHCFVSSNWIVTLHEGRIEVESPPEGGTCFTVSLPVGVDGGTSPSL